MNAEREQAGWAWFEPQPEPELVEAELCRAFARCFSGAHGEMVMDHLKRLILDRRLPPTVSGAELRHLEGQRYAIAYLIAMVERGRTA